MTSPPSAPYYKNIVKLSRLFTVSALIALALATACDRGACPAQTGQLAPDFTVSDGATQVHLAAYRGHVVLVNFWATWCAPCVAEMPSLVALHHALPELTLVAISVDQDEAAYKKFLVSRRIDLVTVRDPQERAAKLFHSEAWPETYVIDRRGIIRRKFIGAQNWTSPEILSYLKSL